MISSHVFTVENESDFQFLSNPNETSFEKSELRTTEINTACDSPLGIEAQAMTCVQKNSKFLCGEPGCYKQFSTKGNLATHQMKHQGLLLFICDFPNCKKAYSEKCRLKTHVRTHVFIFF